MNEGVEVGGQAVFVAVLQTSVRVLNLMGLVGMGYGKWGEMNVLLWDGKGPDVL